MKKAADLCMPAKGKNKSQLGFYTTFEEQLNHQHPLYKLGKTIQWKVVDTAFEKHYSLTQGKPAKPICLMVALLILKQLRNLSDEINVSMAAAAMNFKRVMKLWKQGLINFLFFILKTVYEALYYKYAQKLTF